MERLTEGQRVALYNLIDKTERLCGEPLLDKTEIDDLSKQEAGRFIAQLLEDLGMEPVD